MMPYHHIARSDTLNCEDIKMRQVQFSRFGGPEVLETVEKPTPIPDRDQVLVRVRAVGVNFSDTLMRQNRYAVTPALPAIPRTEVAGTVERLVAPDAKFVPQKLKAFMDSSVRVSRRV